VEAVRVIPVLDLKSGLAVHARAGDRAHYQPLRSLLHDSPDPLELARAYRERLGLREIYLADLDAISGRPPDLPLIEILVERGMTVWLDAGVREARDVGALVAAGVSQVVLGLETLRGPDHIRAIVEQFGTNRVVFSLDMRDGRPVVAPDSDWYRNDPMEWVELAAELGILRLIVLDLSRVGTATGVGGMDLVSTIRTFYPSLELILGGGVAGSDDLIRLARAGASAVLVGSALHDGRIGASDLFGR
jgi:phosphoribosylformimino-5-aminoimidazole carboxamide ribotide isomerase